MDLHQCDVLWKVDRVIYRSHRSKVISPVWQFPTHLIGGSPFNMRVLLDLQCNHMIGILLPDCLTCMIQAFRGRFPGGPASKRIWRSSRQLHSKHGGSLTSNDPDLWSTSSSACTLDSPPSCNTEKTTSASGSSHIPIERTCQTHHPPP